MRDHSIDILRFVGLAMVVLAHVGPPAILFQLRNFDVPLMVLVSGMAFGLSYRVSESYIFYLWKRIKRLVFPVWIFLTFYFLAQYFVSPNSGDLNTFTIVTSYCFIGGIGYVWIIQVFLLVALVSPFVYKWHLSENSDARYFGVLMLSFLAYEIFRYLSLPYLNADSIKYISTIPHYLIAYAMVFAIGLRLPVLKAQKIGYISAISLLLLMGCIGLNYAFTGSISTTQDFKYPPSIYYISYAIFVSTLLWMFRGWIEKLLEVVKLKSAVLFCAKHTIWIYLWHIPFVNVVHANFVIQYGVILGCSIAITCIQVSLVNAVVKCLSNDSVKRNVKALFTG